MYVYSTSMIAHRMAKLVQANATRLCMACLSLDHRYRKAKIDCLSFVYVPATIAAHNRLLFFVFAAAIYSTNEENMRR